MIKQIGTKIYYCNVTGNVIKIIGDIQGFVRETTFDEDYEIFEELKERDKKSVGLIQLKFGEYSNLAENSTGVKVNVDTKELEFTYEPLPEAPQPPSLESRVKSLEEVMLNLI